MTIMDVINRRLHPYKLEGGEVRIDFAWWYSRTSAYFRIWRRSGVALWETRLVICTVPDGWQP